MKIKTSDLTGPALDWAVAKCEGVGFYGTTDPDRYDLARGFTHNFNPSVDWSQGGPIIEREEIELGVSDPEQGGWFACMNNDLHSIEMMHYAHADTPLIAAMRCYVASKLGDEIEIPEELC